MYRRIKIELRSDMCMANGDGFGSVIDTDICTDSSGIPFIPARRLKGVLKAAAEYIDCGKISEIFGKTGASDTGSLKVSDAYITDYEELKNEIENNGLYHEQVTGLFTDIKASTAINKDGHAENNSLRFTRVLENSLPWDRDKNAPLVFYSDIEIDEAYKNELERICKALRHMGYKRNRGFGAVKCELVPSDRKEAVFTSRKCDNEKLYVINYAVKNKSELMLPGKGANMTQDYISGSSVMGLLAREYLKKGSVDEEFEQLFMNNEVKFSNLYITGKTLEEYIPVPGIFGKDKTEKADENGKSTIYNIVRDRERIKAEGKMVKTFKDGYMNNKNDKPELKAPLTEIIYHNANTGKADKKLYTQNCISKGQYFRGSITAEGKYINILQNLLLNAGIRFGRSRTAQYSECELVSFDVSEVKNTTVTADKYLMYVLESDVMLCNDEGNITTEVNELIKALGIPDTLKPENESSIRYKTITGFNTVMRLHRPHVRAFGAGSVIVVKSYKKSCESVMYIGERLNEGFGRVRVSDAEKFPDTLYTLENKESQVTVQKNRISKLCKKLRQREELRMSAINYAKEKKNKILELNSAAIGRVTLMAKESKNYDDLMKRIESIKTGNTYEIADYLINGFKSEHLDKENWDMSNDTEWKEPKEYIILMLTIAKYLKKQEEKII